MTEEEGQLPLPPTEEEVLEYVNRMLAALVDGSIFDPRESHDD